MTPAALREAAEADPSSDPEEGCGLLCGINAFHLRLLCENPWQGGGGFSANTVGRLSLDQICFHLTQLDVFKSKAGGGTKVSLQEASGILTPREDGALKVRTADGKVVWLKSKGKSVAERLWDEHNAKQEAEKTVKVKTETKRDRQARKRRKRGG